MDKTGIAALIVGIELLVLGAYALCGCIIAALLRGWFTRGAHWKDEKVTEH